MDLVTLIFPKRINNHDITLFLGLSNAPMTTEKLVDPFCIKVRSTFMIISDRKESPYRSRTSKVGVWDCKNCYKNWQS